MPKSSSVQLGDLALVWDGDVNAADLAILDLDLATDAGIETAVMLSMYCDRRADPDDAPPSGDPLDRRGWWADQFAEAAGDKIGSRLWLLDRAKRTTDVALRARELVREALAWMLEDRVVERIDVAVLAEPVGLVVTIELHRPARDPVSLRFAHTWEGL